MDKYYKKIAVETVGYTGLRENIGGGDPRYVHTDFKNSSSYSKEQEN